MRLVRVGGLVAAMCALLCGMALRMDSLSRASIWICLGAMGLCFAEKPQQRASLLGPAICVACSGALLMNGQAGEFMLVPGAAGDMLYPAGESASRTLAGCIFALIGGAWIGQMLMEAFLGKGAFGAPAGYAGLPVRFAALLCALIGMGACMAPGLTEYIRVPASVQTVLAFFGAFATSGTACYVAASKTKVSACIVLLLYMACAVFDAVLFAQHAFFALAFSLFLCARGNSRKVLVCLVPVPAVLLLCKLYPADNSALSLYAQRLWQGIADFAAPGGLEWILQIYARFGVLGYIVAGLLAGALLYLLGRLLRDSFLYAAPVLFALSWACLALLRGLDFAPSVPDYVFFAIAYGLCLIVGCIKRASRAKPKKKR